MLHALINGSSFNLKDYYQLINDDFTETKRTRTEMKPPLFVRRLLTYQHKLLRPKG